MIHKTTEIKIPLKLQGSAITPEKLASLKDSGSVTVSHYEKLVDISYSKVTGKLFAQLQARGL